MSTTPVISDPGDPSQNDRVEACGPSLPFALHRSQRSDRCPRPEPVKD